MAATASGAPRLTCRGCKGTIDIPGLRVGDAARCPACGAQNVVLRSKTQGDVPPAIVQGGLSQDESRAKRDEYRRAMSACLESRGYTVR